MKNLAKLSAIMSLMVTTAFAQPQMGGGQQGGQKMEKREERKEQRMKNPGNTGVNVTGSASPKGKPSAPAKK